MNENLPPEGTPGSVPPSPRTEASLPSGIPEPAPLASSAMPVAEPTPALPPPPPLPPVASAPPPLTTPPPPPLSIPPPQFHAPPPPPRTPPPPIMMPAPPAPRGGRGWKILAVLLFIGLGASLLANLNLFSRSLSAGGKGVHQKRTYMEEVTLEENHSENKIAVVEIEGVISSRDSDRQIDNMVEDVRKQLKAAAKDTDVRAVILKVNSPGGEVLASDEIYNAIADFQDRTGKPVVASMQTLAASGGYYVSAPCRWIVANEMTITGSIGVIMQGFNFHGLMNKVGVHAETYKSGKFKDMLSPLRAPEEIPDEERLMMQELIMETYGKFTNIVETGRSEAFLANSKLKEKGQSLDEDWAKYADGRVLSGRQAYELGFVDELGDFRTAVDRAETLAKITKANLIQYQQPFDLGDLFRIFGQTQDRSVKVDLGVKLPQLQPGCLYFIYRQAVQ